MVKREYEPGSIQKESEMTPEYRATLLKLLADQAKAELFASHTYSKWVRRAPGHAGHSYQGHPRPPGSAAGKSATLPRCSGAGRAPVRAAREKISARRPGGAGT